MTAPRPTRDDRNGRRLSIRLAVRESVPVVAVGGELDHSAERRLSKYVAAVAATVGGRIELDLRSVRSIDPAGVRLLVEMRRRFGAERLSIVPSEAVARAVHFVAIGERNRRMEDE
jgi:anti-anti-sigma factor